MKKSAKANRAPKTKRGIVTNGEPTADDIAVKIATMLGIDPDSVQEIRISQAPPPHVKRFRIPKWTVTVEFADVNL